MRTGLRDPRLAADTRLARTQLYALARDLPPVGAPVADPALAACLRALGDARFDGLPAFPSLPGWWFYEGRG